MLPRVETGEKWAHRASKTKPLVEVEILAIGSRRPARIKIAFQDDEREGETAWVPPSQLKCPWKDREQFIERNQAWEKLTAPFASHIESEDEASQFIFDAFFQPRGASRLSGRREGLTAVQDGRALFETTGLTRDDLGEGFKVDGSEETLLPWPVAVVIAQAYLGQHSERVLSAIDREAEKERLEATRGHYITGGGRGPDRYFGPSPVGAKYSWIAVRETVRQWAGAEKTAEHAQIRLLRETLSEATKAMNDTIAKLVDAGQAEIAWSMHHWLYPEAAKKRWRSVAKMMAEGDQDAWGEYPKNLRERQFLLIVKHEIETSALYGQEPAKWAWSERVEKEN